LRQNLDLHARLYHLPAEKIAAKIAGLADEFGLADHLDDLAEDLPLGIRQRLSLAVAVIHDPEMLILDEPTSGVDPVARDQFWELLIKLSRERSVTIFIRFGSDTPRLASALGLGIMRNGEQLHPQKS